MSASAAAAVSSPPSSSPPPTHWSSTSLDTFLFAKGRHLNITGSSAVLADAKSAVILSSYLKSTGVTSPAFLPQVTILESTSSLTSSSDNATKITSLTTTTTTAKTATWDGKSLHVVPPNSLDLVLLDLGEFLLSRHSLSEPPPQSAGDRSHSDSDSGPSGDRGCPSYEVRRGRAEAKALLFELQYALKYKGFGVFVVPKADGGVLSGDGGSLKDSEAVMAMMEEAQFERGKVRITEGSGGGGGEARGGEGEWVTLAMRWDELLA